MNCSGSKFYLNISPKALNYGVSRIKTARWNLFIWSGGHFSNTDKIGKFLSGSLTILTPDYDGGMSKAGAVRGLIPLSMMILCFLIISIHFKPSAIVGGDATPKGMFFKVGGF